jgi:hypothetical protein
VINVDDYRSQAQFSSETQQGHEGNVLSVRSLVVFAVGLVATVILSGGIVGLVMSGFSGEVKGLRALAPPRFEDKSGLFPNPRIQANPDVELEIVKQEEFGRLNGYGWVDKKAGVAHIPIDRAIDILAKTGLPRVEAKAVEPVGAAPPATPPSTPTKQEPKP